MRRITTVMVMPISGSATGTPKATTQSARHHREARVGVARAWSPSAISAGLFSLCPARVRIRAAIQFPMKPDSPRPSKRGEVLRSRGV